MVEQLQDPNRHSALEKAGAIGMAVVSLAANNMPGVGHESKTVVSRQVEHHKVIDQVPVDLGEPEDTVIKLTPDVNNQYRVDFETTADDANSSEAQVRAELENVLGPDDWARVFDIQVIGEASAEDEQPGGGFRAESAADTNLAQQRALLAARPVIDVFGSKGVDVMKPVQKGEDEAPEPMLGVRGVEDSWTEEDLASAQSFAEKFGYDSVERMVEDHNDGNTPPVVDEFLKPLLEDHRGATVLIRLRNDGGEGRSILVTTTHDKVTVKDIPRDVTVTEVVNNQVEGYIPEVEQMVVSEPRQIEHVPKDALYRDKTRAPQGNGARPVRFGGGVPYNPTPSNFRK